MTKMESVSPFDVHLLLADFIYQFLQDAGYQVLYDRRLGETKEVLVNNLLEFVNNFSKKGDSTVVKE
ncbi:hypothetical protein [Paenibacillus sp. YYML68]|uniref:hypothetical protein n=1 Tax=Paenibacillus sp. YYML68 TaxID=2909250 RepID=UPI002491967B|nr:hypothetical protein [Paenibacillus sp. YYML68]